MTNIQFKQGFSISTHARHHSHPASNVQTPDHVVETEDEMDAAG